MSLQIIKLSNKSWKHIDSIDGTFILSKFYIKTENNKFLIIEIYGSKRREYDVTEIEVYDIGGTAETFANIEDLILRLEELNYTGFYQEGDVDISGKLDKSTTPSSIYATDASGNQEMVAKNTIGGSKYIDYFQFLTTRQTNTATGTWKSWSISYNGTSFWSTPENLPLGTEELPTQSNNFGIVVYKEDIEKLKYLIWEEIHNDIYSKQILIKKVDVLLPGTGSNSLLNERIILNEIISFNAGNAYRPIRFKFLVDDHDDTPEGYCSKYMLYIKDISGAGFSTRTIRWRFLER